MIPADPCTMHLSTGSFQLTKTFIITLNVILFSQIRILITFPEVPITNSYTCF